MGQWGCGVVGRGAGVMKAQVDRSNRIFASIQKLPGLTVGGFMV